MSKVHHFFLRRSCKNSPNSPFSTVGVAVNPKTGNLHIGVLTLHSSDTHFIKAKARHLIPRKVFGESGYVVRTADIHLDIGSDLHLSDYVTSYVWHHILDHEKAQAMFMGIVRDAVTEYDIANDFQDDKDTAEKIDRHITQECAP